MKKTRFERFKQYVIARRNSTANFFNRSKKVSRVIKGFTTVGGFFGITWEFCDVPWAFAFEDADDFGKMDSSSESVPSDTDSENRNTNGAPKAEIPPAPAKPELETPPAGQKVEAPTPPSEQKVEAPTPPPAPKVEGTPKVEGVPRVPTTKPSTSLPDSRQNTFNVPSTIEKAYGKEFADMLREVKKKLQNQAIVSGAGNGASFSAGETSSIADILKSLGIIAAAIVLGYLFSQLDLFDEDEDEEE